MAERLVSFNIQNTKYAIKKNDGTYDTPVAFSSGGADNISLEADYSEEVIYGDGHKILTIPSDKGKTGSLVILDIDEAYEIAMGRSMASKKGVMEVKQYGAVEHAIYFEFNYIDKATKATKVAKTWVYGVTSGRPKLAFNQSTDSITHNNCEYSLTIKGIEVLDDAGKVALDVNGNTIYAWQETLIPGDTGYDTFGATCEAPKVASTTKAVKK